jgi:MFS family permease
VTSIPSPAARAAVPAGLLIAAGCVVAMLNFGPRATMGFFMAPITEAGGFGRDVFSFAFAVQQLVWGIGQPFAGAIADKYGTHRVLIGGAVLYGLGLALMAVSTDPTSLVITSGVLIGFGLAGASFNVVLAAFTKILPPQKRAMALGFGTAAGSFGQFLFTPLAPALIDGTGWQSTLVIFALLQLLVLPLAFLLWTAPAGTGAGAGGADGGPQSLGAALKEALSHPSYVLLVLGFFTCGFQLAFITGHLPQYLLDKGVGTIELFGRNVSAGGLTLALIGLFNIAGSLGAGWLVGRVPRRWLLAVIYALRSLAIAAFVLLPVTPTTALVFGASMGLLWLSTVPPTSALVALMFGVRYMSMLYGFVFFSHQVGGFLGAWLGGVLYEATKSYDVVWWLSVALGVASAVINLPIRERPIDRPLAPSPA